MEKMNNPFFEGTETEDEQVDVIFYFEKKFNIETDNRQRLAINILLYIAKTDNANMRQYLKEILTMDQYMLLKHQYLSDYDADTNKFKSKIGMVAEREYISEIVKALYTIAYNAAALSKLK